MASPKIIPKKSVQLAKIPLSTDLESGEICINHADKKLYAKHPATGAIQEIGGTSEHSHDELYSIDGTQHLELQNNGSLVLNGATTITLPSVSGTLATSRASRSQWASPYLYLGFAAAGTAESAATWTIYRDEISSTGTVTSKLSATGSWSNKTNLTYA